MFDLISFFIIMGLITNVMGLVNKNQEKNKNKPKNKAIPAQKKTEQGYFQRMNHSLKQVQDLVKSDDSTEATFMEVMQNKQGQTQQQRNRIKQYVEEKPKVPIKKAAKSNEDRSLSAGLNPERPENVLTEIEQDLQRQGKLNAMTVSDDMANMEAEYDQFQDFLDEAVDDLMAQTTEFVEEESHIGKVVRRNRRKGQIVPTDLNSIKQGIVMATILERREFGQSTSYNRRKGV